MPFAFILIGLILLVLVALFISVAIISVVLGTAASLDVEFLMGDEREDTAPGHRH